ncbi:phage capsid protein [Roseibium aquae]|uniref:Phage capsid protein n=1 Tax=Roseibium aquae TaxID=1323746 RepID=A0A916TKK7_9HYPH|nr:phage major capsid protein [Roseibium aquae]GGB50960.1 phage capsid protein [Roseibium aquae]
MPQFDRTPDDQPFEFKASMPGMDQGMDQGRGPAIPPFAGHDEPGATGGEEVARSFDIFFRAFEAYRQTNDARLEEIERRGSADVLTLDKLNRLDAALDATKRRLDDLTLKARRPALAPEARRGFTSQALEHKAAFETYLRSGRETSLRPLELKALSAGSDPDGGYLVPEQTEAEILRRMAEVSPIRAIAGNRHMSASTFKKPFAVSGPQAGWVAETAARPETTSPQLAELSFPAMELYAMPAATASLLDDAAVDMDAWIAEEVETAFAEQEGTAFVTGDGVNKPAGFLSVPRVAEASWAWGSLGTISTGEAGAFPASAPSDTLIDLIYSLKSGYRQNARFVMNRKTQGAIRKLKDADGNYLWQPPASAGAPSTLMNFPVTEAEDMPDIATDAAAIAFGDFRRGYLVVDRMGVRLLRDPYSAKPYVLFYTTKRVGGGVQDFDAIKLLTFSA